MSKIKVKVWDTKDNKWLTKEPEVELIHKEKSWGNEYYLEIKQDWETDDLTRYVFVESTGLKDKNGKEIYEGDMVRAFKPNSYLTGTKGMLVIWDDTLGGFIYDDYFGKSRKYQIGNNKGGAWCEVIGNIYENPELLNSEK
jgi:uncharacterized phage protein (TIGR01671 family)